ncbi:MAG: baseplate assembly protein [Aeromonas sp.]
MAKIDLALLPELTIIKQMTHEEIQAEMVQVGGLDQMTASDPAFRAMLAGSYRESLLRQDVDDQIRSVMLATAYGAQLDHLGVTYYRDINGDPVTRLDGETDDAYRLRLHESPAGLSTAGPASAYEFHAKSAHPNIKQALCTSPEPVHIVLYLLGYEGSGEVTQAQCELVEGYLWTRRPLTDYVKAIPAKIQEYRLRIGIKQGKNPDPDGVTARSLANVENYVALQHKLKGRITTSALHAVAMVAGVEEVILYDWADIRCGEDQAPYCLGVEMSFEGWSEDDATTLD